MGRTWNITVDNEPYAIQLKSYNVVVNGEKSKLRSLYTKRTMLQSQYSVPVGSKKALLVVGSFGRTSLVIDGKDCATGEDYVPLKIPKWAYVFVVLQLVNCINGAVGIVFAFFGITATLSVSGNPKFSTPVKILLDIVILFVIFIIEFGIILSIYSSMSGLGS